MHECNGGQGKLAVSVATPTHQESKRHLVLHLLVLLSQLLLQERDLRRDS